MQQNIYRKTVELESASRRAKSFLWVIALWASGCHDASPSFPAQGCPATQTQALVYLGPDGTYVSAIADTPWGILIGTDHGLYQCGETTGFAWMHVGPDHLVSSILVVPSSPPRVLVGVRNRSDETTDAAVYASVDSGRTWIPWDGGLAATNDHRAWAYSLAMDPADPNRLFMGQSYAILRSDDGGQTWSYVVGRPGDFAQGVRAISVGETGTVYAAGTSAFSAPLFYTSADGSTWAVGNPVGLNEASVLSMAVAGNRPDRVWLGINGGVLVSTDGGESWRRTFTNTGLLAASLLMRRDTLYLVGTLLSSSSPKGRLALYRSANAGETWTEMHTPVEPGGSDVSALDRSGRILIGTTPFDRGGVWRLRVP